MRAGLYTRTSAADLQTTAADLLAKLRRYTREERGWDIALELADRGPGIAGPREAFTRLTAAIRNGAVDVLVTTSLARLCRSLSHILDLADLLRGDPQAGRGEIALIALEDLVDTTTLEGRVRWADAIDLFRRVRHEQRSEGIRLARIKAAARGIDDNWGRPAAAINPLELAGHWHGGPTRRPLSVREIAKRLGYAQGTIRRHIRDLLEAGKLRPEERDRHLRAAGGLSKGGRPVRSQIDLEALAALWHRGASATALRQTFHCAPARIEQALTELRGKGRLDDAKRAASLERKQRKNR